MSTVTELVQLICDETGLDDTTGSEERRFALARLNGVYARLVADLELDDEVTIAVTGGTADVDVSASMVEANHVGWRTSANDQSALTRVTMDQMFKLRAAAYGQAASGSEVPTEYAFSYPNVMLYPTPGADGTLVAYAVVAAPTLVETGATGGQEETPSLIPAAFHESVLVKGSITRVLEGYEGEEERAAGHRALFEMEVGRLREWRRRSGGRGSQRRRHSPWGTPDRIGAR